MPTSKSKAKKQVVEKESVGSEGSYDEEDYGSEGSSGDELGAGDQLREVDAGNVLNYRTDSSDDDDSDDLGANLEQ